jgi:hypothetical protein
MICFKKVFTNRFFISNLKEDAKQKISSPDYTSAYLYIYIYLYILFTYCTGKVIEALISLVILLIELKKFK